MSTASLAKSLPASSQTTRQFGQAVCLAFVAVAVGCGLYGVETFGFGASTRFVENPTEVMVRTFGLAHFAVGWLFLVSSPAMRSPKAMGRIIGWAAVGSLLCLGYWQLGGGKNPWLLLGFYSLFLIHEIRDQAELFLARGDGPPASPDRDRTINWLCLAATLILLTLLLGGYLMQATLFRGSSPLLRVDFSLVGVGLGLLVVAAAISFGCFVAVGRRTYGGVHQLYVALEPLLLVYLTLAGFLLAVPFLGSGAFNLIILIHVMTWLVTVHQRLGPTPAAWPGLWTWLRRTRAGFLTLHLVVALLILGLLALRVHAWGRAGLVGKIFSGSSFPYWSLLHIAISFAKRP